MNKFYIFLLQVNLIFGYDGKLRSLISFQYPKFSNLTLWDTFRNQEKGARARFIKVMETPDQ